MCLPCSFLPLLATQAQLHRTVDSPWTADEIPKQHTLCLLSLQLISKNGVLSFLFRHLVLGVAKKRKEEEGEKGETELREKQESKDGARE